jgi:hypothetical protein
MARSLIGRRLRLGSVLGEELLKEQMHCFALEGAIHK